MLRELAAVGGLSFRTTTEVEDLDLRSLAAMIDAAWRADYVDRNRPAYAERSLEDALRGVEWLAVLALGGDGRVFGFELAFARVLRVRGRPLRAHYPALLAVSPDRRRCGIGRSLVAHLHHEALREHGSDVIFSTFEGGQSGAATVRVVVDATAGWRIRTLGGPPIWVRRVDDELTGPPAPLSGIGRLTLVDGDLKALPGTPADAPCAPPSLEVVDRAISGACSLAFALTGGFAAAYLGRAEDAGVLWTDSGNASRMALLFRIVPLVRNAGRTRLTAQIQSVHVFGSSPSPDAIEDTLRRAAAVLRRRGVSVLSVFEQTAVPAELLARLGFVRADVQLSFALRGPAERVDALEEVIAPNSSFWLDAL